MNIKRPLKEWCVRFSAIVAIPMTSSEGWTELQFRKIPSNSVTFSSEGAKVQVQNSASPLVYKLSKSIEVQKIEVEIEVTGDLKVATADSGFQEDSYFRLGLVAEGTQKLNRFQKMLAPAWVEKLYSLAPSGVGLDKIYFYNVGTDGAKIGDKRIHPKSELMSEEVVAKRSQGQRSLRFQAQIKDPKRVAALWISIDGDETKSEFTTVIKSIQLTSTSP